jgi:menaquinone-dependent protoporphyrinogen IX oxidase
MIAEEIGRDGQPVEVRRIEEVTTLEPYGAVVIGAPMILGWHRAAQGFVRRHAAALSALPVACFATAMALTQEEKPVPGAPDLFLDPALAQKPKNPRFLNPKERYTAASNYLRPMLHTARSVHPVSAAIFGGKLEVFRLKWWQALFVLLIVRAQPGDYRDPACIRAWGARLKTLLAASD